jgi:benzoyl-CoA reductase/2-hydroxyglutaryl-CoA dehydratase subunit BcrC/BadD/HgdB
MLTEALESSENWDGIIFAHGCDATHRHFDIWKEHVSIPFIHFINNPMSRVSKSGRKFFKSELKQFILAVEDHFQVEITNEKLHAAITLSNQIKIVLQQMGKLRETKDIPNREYFDVCKMALQEQKSSLISKLQHKLEIWKSYNDLPSKYAKILLTGTDVTYPEFMDLLENAKLRVVRDDLSIGERYYATLIPEMEDPLDALIEYQYLIPRPSTKHPVEPRLEFILDAYESSNIDGILSQNLKFCEDYAYDSVWLADIFKRKKITSIHLERDYTTDDQQLFTRLEAFYELLAMEGQK